MKFLAFALLLVACGDDAPTQPDGGGGGSDGMTDGNNGVPDFTPGCENTAWDGDMNAFSKAEDLGPFVPGTLAGWNPDGRWFLTGTRVGGVSSFHLNKQGDNEIIVDRDTGNPGTIDNDAVFQRYSEQGFIIVKRVVNRGNDGTARADRVVCDGGNCRQCTAKLEYATYADPQEHDKLTLVGQLFGNDWDTQGYTFNVRVAGTIAYLIRQDGLHMIETADPAHPVELGKWRRAGDGYSNDVKIVDTANKRYAIIADTPVDVVDVTNPAQAMLVAQIPEEAHTVALETRAGKTYAVFGNYDATAPIYDVTNPAAPMRLGRYRSPGQFVHDLSIENGLAYLNSWDAGLEVVDFTTPANPQLVGTWADTPTDTSHSNWTMTVNGRHFALHGEESYGAHLDLVDVDPTSASYMKPFATWKTRDFISIHNLMAFGNKAYFTYYQDGVRVLDLSDPTTPQLSGYYNTWDPQADYTTSAFFEGAVGLDVDVARKLIFVADSPRGLLILRDDT